MKGAKTELPLWAKLGVKIWVEVRDAGDIEVVEYLEGEITLADHDNRVLKAKLPSGEEKELKGDRIHERLETHGIVTDLSDIPILNDAELLKHLELRYKKDLIYCFCGPTLIAINPYKKVPLEENEDKRHEIMQCYLDKNLKNVPPHVWAISVTSFDYLFSQSQNQAICISGESGAGKTESTKRCMEFITNMKGERKSLGYVPIEQKIMSCNPILEAFGNAKTFRNDNSSRFGKYTVLFVDKTKKNVKGASIENYLLEKSRIVKLGKEERNYHVFYAMCRFMNPETQKKYLLNNDGDKVNMEKYNYINQTGVYIVTKINDKEFYEDVTRSFVDLDFSEGQQDAIWRMLSTILQLGNLKIDTSTFVEGSKPCGIIKDEIWQKIIKLLNIDEAALEEALTNKELRIGNSVTKSPLTPARVQNSIDSMSKEIYNRMFNWIVKKLNKTLLPTNPKDPNFSTIGILDIFGFEIFEKNSIEQFMINFANERLQSLYIDYIFKNECKIFEEEGLGQFTANIVYKDNRPLVLCLDNPKLPPGIFDLIDQTCSLNKTDENLHAEIVRTHKSGIYIVLPRFATVLSFTVKHTARDVEYLTDGFVEKNKDEMSPFLQRAIDTSITDVVEIFNEISGLGITRQEMEEKEKASKNPKEKYLGFKFRRNMDDLINQLSACYCHFIRCIKPNELKKSDFWNPQLALMQIRYMGLLDSLKVRKMSYPFRYDYKKFFELFQDLDTGPNGAKSFLQLTNEGANFMELSKELLKTCEVKFDDKDILYGKTRIFVNEKFKIALEKVLLQKQKKKKESLKVIAQLFKNYNSKKNIHGYFQKAGKSIMLARDLVRSWTSKLVAMKHKNYIKLIRKIQVKFRSTRERRQNRLRAHNMQTLSKFFALCKFSGLFIYLLNKKRKVAMIQGMIQKKLLDGKNRFCRSFAEKAFDQAWNIIKENIQSKAAKDLQRSFRSHLLRKTKKSEIEEFAQKLETARVYNAAVTIQKIVRGYLVRKRQAKLHRAAAKIQGFFRMVWMRDYLRRMKAGVPKIQKAFRRFAVRNKEMKARLKSLMNENETYNNSVARVEHNILFADEGAINSQVNEKDHSKLPFKPESAGDYGKSNYRLFIPDPPNIEVTPKVKLVSVLVDLDVNVDTTNIYHNTWAQEFNQFVKRIHAKGSRLLHLEIGESFTLAVSEDKEIFTWGLNDYHQCAVDCNNSFSVSQNIVKNLSANPVRMVSVGKDHGLFLDEGNNLYSWGKNSEGQLGLGNSKESRSINCLSFLCKEPIKLISAKEGVNYVVAGEGKVWTWPSASAGHALSPVELQMPTSIKIQSLDVGCDFSMFLATNGLLYAMGKNKYGELGLGDFKDCATPTVVKSLKDGNEKVVEVSCGLRHTIVRTTLSKVFVWGYNKNHQLGLNDTDHRNAPVRVSIPEFKNFRFKPRSVQANLNGAMILLDDRQLFYFGKVGKTANIAKIPTRFVYEDMVFQTRMADDFTPVRVYSKWSKTLTATYIVFLDFRKYPEGKTMREKLADKVCSDWTQVDKQVLPNSDDILAKHIHSKYLEKPLKIAKPNVSFSNKQNDFKDAEIIEIDNQTPLSDLKKTFIVALAAIVRKPTNKRPTKQSVVDSQIQVPKISETKPMTKPPQENGVKPSEKGADLSKPLTKPTQLDPFQTNSGSKAPAHSPKGKKPETAKPSAVQDKASNYKSTPAGSKPVSVKNAQVPLPKPPAPEQLATSAQKPPAPSVPVASGPKSGTPSAQGSSAQKPATQTPPIADNKNFAPKATANGGPTTTAQFAKPSQEPTKPSIIQATDNLVSLEAKVPKKPKGKNDLASLLKLVK